MEIEMFELHHECVPIPAAKNGLRVAQYPFAAMTVNGPPFFAPNDLGKSNNGASKRQNSITSSALSWAKTHCPDAKFITRKMPDGTIGCWRIA